MKHIAPVVAAALVLAASCVRAPGIAPSAADVSQQSTIIQLEPYIGRFVTARAVVGGDTLRLLFDTGGGYTLVSPDAAARMRCVPTGRVVDYRMSGELFEFPQCPGAVVQLGAFRVQHAVLGVFDLMKLLPAGVPRVDGVLSLATFAGRTVTIDLACRRLTVESKRTAEARPRGMQRVDMRIATGMSGGGLTAFVRARSRGLPRWLELDSGNMSDVLLSPAGAAQLGLAAADSVRDTDIELAGTSVRRMRTRVQPVIYDGVLNEAFVKSALIMLDLGAGVAWVGPPTPVC